MTVIPLRILGTYENFPRMSRMISATIRRFKRESTLRHCNEVVETLVEILVKCEEGNTDDLDFQYFLRNTERSLNDIVVGAFLSLSVFCEVS